MSRAMPRTSLVTPAAEERAIAEDAVSAEMAPAMSRC